MLSSIWDDPTCPLLSPTALPAGPADGALQMCFAPIGRPASSSSGSIAELQVSFLMRETLQRIVGGEEGVSACQSAGKRKIRRIGVFSNCESQRSDGETERKWPPSCPEYKCFSRTSVEYTA